MPLAACLALRLPADSDTEAWLRHAERVLSPPPVSESDAGRYERGPGIFSRPLPTDLTTLQAELRSRIEAGGSKAARWRAVRIATTVLTQPPETIVRTVQEDLAALTQDPESFSGKRLQQIFDTYANSLRGGSDPAAVVAEFRATVQRALKEFEELRSRYPKKITSGEAAALVGGPAELERLAAAFGRFQKQAQEYSERIGKQFGQRRPDAKALKKAEAGYLELIARFERSLSPAEQTLWQLAAKNPTLQYYMQRSTHPEMGPDESDNLDHFVSEVTVPDLAGTMGEAEARALLTELLVSPLRLQVKASPTAQLLKALALEQISRLPRPRYELVQGTADGPLFAAFDQAFPQRSRIAAQKRREALAWYAAWLLSEGRQEEAETAFAAAEPYAAGSVLRALAEGGKLQPVFTLLAAVARRSPAEADWQMLGSSAVQLGQGEAFLALARESAGRTDLPAPQRSAARARLARALLAVDQVEEGLGLLRDELATAPKSAGKSLAMLGRLLNRPEDEARGWKAWLESENGSSERHEMLTFLHRAGRPAQAWELAGRWLAEKRSPSPNGRSDDERTWLSQLFHARLAGGQPREALRLLAEDPRWAASDLRQLLGEKEPGVGALALQVAEALRQTGDKARARSIVEAYLRETPGDDDAYALWRELTGEDAVPFLDQLAARYPFEERPLIWKAATFLSQGRLSEAEQTIQAAIRIDPSDGEQGPPHRMRAYAVLADIHRRKGESEKVAFFDGVVRAIRKAERADEFREVGLETRAVALYREALGDFADAYCIQSRLARELYLLGRTEEAAAHYRKAFELMPDSFGRMESHCFGCEGVFRGEQARTIAEQVFTAAVAREPQKPQVHYLLAYLRIEQGRPADALPLLQRAVQLDPLYVNAWAKLATLADSLNLPPRERDDIHLKTFELSGELSRQIFDHARAYAAVVAADARAQQFDAATPASLFRMRGKAREEQKRRPLQQLTSLPLISALEFALQPQPEVLSTTRTQRPSPKPVRKQK